MRNILKLLKNLLSNKLVSFFFIPILLIFFWFFCSLFFNNKISFSVLLYKHSKDDLKILPNGKLLKGDKIKGEFMAKDDYLGLLSLRFNQFAKHDFISEEVLLFKLKEKSTNNWYYTNNYRAGLLDNDLTLLIGFPPIPDSKKKIYEFEIESLLGNQNNALEISKKKTVFFSGYKYPKSKILENNASTLMFLENKAGTSFSNSDFLLNSAIYLVPFFLYIFIFLLLFPSPINKKVLYKLSSMLPVLILIDIFLIQEISYGFILFALVSWWLYILIHRLESKHSFIFSFVLIAIWISLVSLHIDKFQGKINIYSYALLVIGAIQAIYEERRKKLAKKVL